MQPQVFVVNQEGIRHAVQRQSQQRLARFDLIEHGLDRRNIAVHADDAGDLATRIAYRRIAGFDKNVLAVLALALGLPADDGFAGHHTLPVFVNFLLLVVWQHPANLARQGFLCGVAEEPFRAGVPAYEPQIEISAGDRIGRRLNGGRQPRIFGFDAPLLGDVLERRHDGHGLVFRGGKNRLCIHRHPAQRLAAGAHADEHVFLRFSAAQRPSYREITGWKRRAVLLNGRPGFIVL